jgi:hypothetical protein
MDTGRFSQAGSPHPSGDPAWTSPRHPTSQAIVRSLSSGGGPAGSRTHPTAGDPHLDPSASEVAAAAAVVVGFVRVVLVGSAAPPTAGGADPRDIVQQQAGEERPGPQLGGCVAPDPQRWWSALEGDGVALGEALRCALVRASADQGRELGLDQGLVDGLGGLADAVVDLRGVSVSRTSSSADWSTATVRCVLSRGPLAWSR